ncbi:MAG: HAMP domain-containing histidine kinase [Alphaproteobacteria bacterium]|nr:HAMP domain-containing histidine kinase [Alphaproteobacteria bacterium]MBU0799203.1 HAMP domain-containing histidine kinase [Alphaproteobacteria bacterium]MBU0887546.1 HAMP domain-containing histidine kinase [Alphaproteobacteria bacterium]MBU1814783.1 HAMP domain-containing histidine kinase [Alphaproteobacteria bacterium]
MISRLAPEFRLPVIAGLIVFIAAVVTTQLALWIGNRVGDRQLENVAQVYLDGLIANVGVMLEQGNIEEVEQRFARAFIEQHGIREKALLVLDKGTGRVILQVGEVSVIGTTAVQVAPGGMALDEATGIAWAGRQVAAAPHLQVVAGLDVTETLQSRRNLRIAVIFVDLLIAALCGLGTYIALRRLSRPISHLMHHLDHAEGKPAAIPDEVIRQADKRSAILLAAFNRMVGGVSEREALAAQLAEREQASALGRLTATIAHEVRNPLGGMATSVSTLKRFGADQAVRQEAIGLLERGIETIDGIVTSTLNLYRPEEERRLSRADFDDLAHLVRPAAAKGQVLLDWRIDLPEAVSLGALAVRQVLLNLLLNACAASPPGGKVTLEAFTSGPNLVCIVSDEGSGMEPGRADRLSGLTADAPESKRLGMDVIVNLMGSLDGCASVQSETETGTVIRVTIPLGDSL